MSLSCVGDIIFTSLHEEAEDELVHQWALAIHLVPSYRIWTVSTSLLLYTLQRLHPPSDSFM